ncbi:predicted protein [Thalassiosira pseudonana CCMP1335]|uniref:Uncharacterized protein n=1 Tax=Thalassiosira pseudonana TaxID=35128 RepID=B8C8X3_THAPS|nr:predicted protein [Thalassiosira pseudonana CCMP1335]EED89951.1 predicted protein [Thalassiosira pseudonana CCMP1335]|eukprot:g5740.t1 g5740   contig20:48467-49036(-)
MPDSDDSSLFSSEEEVAPERDPVEFACSVWNEYGNDHIMIGALLGEDAVRDGPPVLQAARTRTTGNIRRDTQGDTEMQDITGGNAGNVPNPPDDAAAGEGPPDAGHRTQEGAAVGAAELTNLKSGRIHPTGWMESSPLVNSARKLRTWPSMSTVLTAVTHSRTSGRPTVFPNATQSSGLTITKGVRGTR